MKTNEELRGEVSTLDRRRGLMRMAGGMALAVGLSIGGDILAIVAHDGDTNPAATSIGLGVVAGLDAIGIGFLGIASDVSRSEAVIEAEILRRSSETQHASVPAEG